MEAQTEGGTEKDEGVRRTSRSWPGGPGRAATVRRQKKRRGLRKQSCFSEGHFGVFLHWHSGDGTRGVGGRLTSEWGSLLHDSVCFQLLRQISRNSGKFHFQLLLIKMLKEGVTELGF